MKTKKTATVKVYRIFGTKCGVCVDIFYRGRRLFSFEGEAGDMAALIESSRSWVQAQKFTDINYIYG